MRSTVPRRSLVVDAPPAPDELPALELAELPVLALDEVTLEALLLTPTPTFADAVAGMQVPPSHGSMRIG